MIEKNSAGEVDILPATTFVSVDADILLYIHILITVERMNANVQYKL